jgi:hypothetical protein
MELFTKLINILILERSPIISDDRIGDSISANDIIQDERRDLFIGHGCQRDNFNPLCEIFCGCYDELMPI